MSANQPGERPDRSERKQPPVSTGQDTSQDSGRFPVPHSRVIPQFADQPQAKMPPTRIIPPGAPPPQPRRFGCSPFILFAGALLLPLIILALFLPPISLWNKTFNKPEPQATPEATSAFVTVDGLEFTPLNPGSPSLHVDGLTITAASANLSSHFGVHIESLSPADYLARKFPAAGWYCESELPANHALASPVYSLSQTGLPPRQLTLQVAAQADAVADPAALELNLWNATSGTWEFYAAGADAAGNLTVQIDYLPRCVVLLRAAESARRVGVTLSVTDLFSTDVAAANVRVYPGSLHPTPSGALQVVLALGFETGQGYEVIPLITNFDDPAVIDVGTVQRILENAALRSEHARQIAAFILSDSGYAGVALDYREIPSSLHAEYAAFVRDLAELLHSQGRTLTLVLPFPAPGIEPQPWNTEAYDWNALGRAADEVIITMPLDPRAYTSGSTVDKLLDWATTQISRDKLFLGLNALSVEENADGTNTPASLPQAFDYLNEIQITDMAAQPIEVLSAGQTGMVQVGNSTGVVVQSGYNDTLKTIYVRYLDGKGNVLRTLWLTDPAALYARSELADTHKLGGIFVWGAMSPGAYPDLGTALLSYRLDQPMPSDSTALMVEWVVREGDAEIMHESRPLGQPFAFQAGPDEGTLTVEARFQEKILASRTIAIMALSATPTPLPTETSLPTETPLPTATVSAPQTAVPTATAPATGTPVPTSLPAATETPSQLSTATPEVVPLPGLPGTPASTPENTPTPAEGALNLDQPLPTVDPAILAAVSLGTQFEAGVHMAQLGPALIEVNKAHLVWIKLDVTYRIGSTPGAQQRNIQDLQGSGFKVLINVTGDPAEFASIARADYIAQFSAYVSGLALSGVDGIEIWREMNAQMTAAEYVQLLAYSYVAIKTTNPSTMVISGALLPTISSDNPDQSDNVYYDNMAAAGTAQYADCIGEEYRLGTVSPVSTAGDPRGDNPVYYLPSTTDRALHAFEGVRPVCYTRFGYLSPEGYPPLPEAYAWAQNTTAAQQAQWLADAIQLSREGTQIRMLIVWTLESAAFPADSPEAGYAIIRPDGSCPACDTLGTLLKPAS